MVSRLVLSGSAERMRTSPRGMSALGSHCRWASVTATLSSFCTRGEKFERSETSPWFSCDAKLCRAS